MFSSAQKLDDYSSDKLGMIIDINNFIDCNNNDDGMDEIKAPPKDLETLVLE